MTDHSTMKLGKAPARFDPRTLKMSHYLKAPAPLALPPETQDWTRSIAGWPMYANDRLGDCVEAAAGHMVELWDTWTNPSKGMLSNVDIVRAYSGATGYVPGNPNTDNGTDMLKFLKYWRNTGIGGDKILAFMSIEPGNLLELRQGVWLFGAPIIGLQMPVTAQTQADWTVEDMSGDGAPGSWGGHCVPVGGYDYAPPGTIRNRVVSWGKRLSMSNNFYQGYCDEAYVVLSADWIGKNQKTPADFDLSALEADLARL